MLATLDVVIIGLYAVLLIGLATWFSREPAGHEKTTQDYFLASRSLPWWAVGASLVAANISAEQIIGMSGSGYAIGLAIASYEWMAAITLILVGKFLLPVFLKHNIQTMPQFLEQRFDSRVRLVLALFWLAVYVFVNLTAILWLGALTIHTVTGLALNTGLGLIGVFALLYSLYGGLKAVAFTDLLQVVLLIAGGLLISWILLDEIALGAGPWQGFAALLDAAPEKFDMILAPGHPHYISLPGLSVLLGGMWVMNVSYWGFNQYIIQRALAADSLQAAQKGMAFAAFLKLLMPVIVVLPGIAMFVLEPGLDAPDQAYPLALTLLPVGLKGLVFAALLAAIVSSLASMINSIATIFTLDLYGFVCAVFNPKVRAPFGSGGAWCGARGNAVGDGLRPAPIGQFRSGLSIHSGIHRIFYPRDCRDFHAGHVLAPHDGECGADGGSGLSTAIVCLQNGLARTAVY